MKTRGKVQGREEAPDHRLGISAAVTTLLLSPAALRVAAQASGAESGRGRADGAKPVEHVEYVDSVGQSFLFRGQAPLTGGSTSPVHFNYKGLKRAIANAAAQAGVALPAKYAIVDVSQLWVDDLSEAERQPMPQQALLERKLANKEYDFFKANPRLGQAHLWPSAGTEVSPTDAALQACRDALAATRDDWLRDPLQKRVETIRGWMEDPPQIGITRPMVVYVHCYGGCDRTGQLIGAYRMRYMNMTWEEMEAANAAASQRPTPPFFVENCNALRWYARYLNLQFGRSPNWDSPTPCPSMP